MTKEQIKQTAEKELVAYLKGCAFSLCPASQKYMAEHIEEILKASETTKELENENAELKEQNANLIAMLKSEREVRVNDDYLKGICELEGKVEDWTSEYYELENFMNNKLSEAKEIIKGLLGLKSSISSAKDAESRFNIREKAEAFLKEEKE